MERNFIAIIVLLNYFTVKGFGEAEYWFSMLKVITIFAFIVIGFLMILGIMTSSVTQDIHPGFAVFNAKGADSLVVPPPLSGSR